jgi:DNA-binding transcriptional MerR regulator
MARRASAVSKAGTAGMTITAAARAAGLSRTTLMYYERLGLIRPQRRTGSRDRSFGPAELQALLCIARWRAIGLPLETIRALLERPADAPAALRQHLRALDRSIGALREQRRHTLALLGRRGDGEDDVTVLTKAAWTALFRAIGMTDAQMRAWHGRFERDNAAGHRQFLRSLGIGAAEIGRIRRWCRAATDSADR